MTELSQLHVYGKVIKMYKGDGVLEFQDGYAVKAQFESGQFTDGRVVLSCLLPYDDSITKRFFNSVQVRRFAGTTSKGYKLLVQGNIREITHLPDSPLTDEAIILASFTANEMHVQRFQAQAGRRVIHFGLTNLWFIGTRPEKSRVGTTTYGYRVLPLNVDSYEIVLKPVREYDEVLRRVKTLKGIDVTCEAVATVESEEELNRLTTLVNNLCCLLSIARGTKINWIYRDVFLEGGDRVQTSHRYSITKPYVPLAVIDPRELEDTRQFVESSYDTYVHRKELYKLDAGSVDAYLNAKSEHDFIEMRGVKLTVALERLKSLFARAEGIEHIMDQDVFASRLQDLEARFQKFLWEFFNSEIDRTQLKMMASKATGFNRRSFGSIIRCLRRAINLDVSESEIQLFINSRNKLVHYGDFYCNLATEEERQRCPPLSGSIDEWFFLVNFLDRVFLKLAGYRGHYMNWRKVPSEREWLD